MSTGVIEWLKAKDITHVLVGGLATDYCVKATARQLAEAGFRVILNRAACRGIAPDTTEAALDELRAVGVQLIDSVEALEPTA
jgi:nicotinamidase/pyrazinamidase